MAASQATSNWITSFVTFYGRQIVFTVKNKSQALNSD